MQVKSIAECSKESILQYFWPSLIYHLPLRPLFCLFLSGRLRQVLLSMYRRILLEARAFNTIITFHGDEGGPLLEAQSVGKGIKTLNVQY